MRENRAKNIIKDTFNKPFDKERFISFLIHFLNEIDIEVNKKYYNKNISSTFNDHIEKYHYLGRYIDEDGKTIDLLSVKLFNKNSLVKARTLQRNFITHFLSNHNSDGALASFYTDESQSWRFSFVKTKYITENNGESWNFKKDYTSAKRYTYLIGKNEPHHTANKRLLKWIQNDKINPTINNILETFSVEKVTDEFYDEYKRLYDILKNNIDTLINNNREVKKEFKIKDISSADFAKKTLGQVVFLYFLQKKGWLGLENPDTWGNGPKNFFDKLFFQEYYKEYKNFFNDILKYLFYEGLAKQHKNNYYDKLKSYFPFLNGGLFEPINNYDWENIEMEIDNEIFEEIINTFNRYNFTVKEDEPLEVEVAVDPEMLGRVFEKLLGTENQKDKGAYYTPREVVHYMCKESIINYLESEFGENIKREALSLLFDINNFEKEENNLISQLINNAVKIDKKLKNIKICDPAIGSGAFPIGLLHVITRARNNLTKLSDELSSEKRSMYNLKRETIQNSLYGVDIESGAIQIAKLRLWLSLVVDEEDANNIKPLPNLDYKIMQGNSLIEEFAGIKFSNFLNKKKKNNSNNLLIEEKSALENKINQIIKLLQQENKYYFNSTTKEEKHNHESRIDKLLNRLFELRIEQENKQYKREYKKIEKKYAGFKKGTKGLKEKQKELGKLNEKYGIKEKEKKLKKYMNSNKKRDFFLWHLYFAEVFLEKGGFDIIMANPPYIKEYTNKGAFDGLRDSKYYQGKMDIWTFFGCKAIDLLKNNGLLCFIATNNWISNYGASIFRNKITNEGKLLSYLDFQNYKVFANADIQTMILFFKKDKNIEGNYDLTYQKVIDDDLSKKELENFFEGQNIDKILSYPVEIESNKNYKNGINFIEKREKKVLDQLEAVSNFNLNNSKVCAGIDVHQDFIKRSHLNDLNNNNINVGDGIFVLSTKEKNRIDFNMLEEKHIKPYYTSNELHQYYGDEKNNYWIIYNGSDIDNYIDKMPNIKNHLDKYEKIITSDYQPYGLHRSRDEWFFQGEKIMSLRKTKFPKFTYTDFNCYVSQSYYVIKEDYDLKYLTGVLNSKVITFWLLKKGKIQGNNLQIDKAPLMSIPLIRTEENIKFKIKNKVENIIKFKGRQCDINVKFNKYINDRFDFNKNECEKLSSMNNIRRIYNGNAKKIYDFEVEIVKSNAIVKNNGRKLLKLKNKNKYFYKFLKLYLENLTKKDLKSIDDFKGNVTTKVLKKEIPFINDINKIKRIIQEWDEKKKKVDKYNKKISKLKKEIDKEVYNLYELDDKHINIIEKSIETHN